AVAVGALADLLDEAAELVAVDARRRYGVADRRVPVVDVLVGAADRRGGDADQDLVRARLRVGTLADLRAGRTIDGSGLYDGKHVGRLLGSQVLVLRSPNTLPLNHLTTNKTAAIVSRCLRAPAGAASAGGPSGTRRR